MIFTLDGRNNVLLPLLLDTLDLSNQECAEIVDGMLSELKEKLLAKNIEYANLKSALIPVHKDRKETAFIFDSSLIEDAWYGNVVFHHLLPGLNKESTYSILEGDIIAERIPLNVSKEIIFEKLVQFNFTNFQHPSQYYVVYINNLTESQQNNIIEALRNQAFFVGYVDMTFSSRLKTLLAYSLTYRGIKHRDIIILPHEEDREDEENINNCGYPFEDYGFSVKSISEMYYTLFLSYKIEAAFADPMDLSYSINAIYSNIKSVFKLPVFVSGEKLLYLKEKKTAIMEKLGLMEFSTEELSDLIKERIKKGYFYNLEYLEAYHVPKFNLSLELKTSEGNLRKVLVALKYSTEQKRLELVTMY